MIIGQLLGLLDLMIDLLNSLSTSVFGLMILLLDVDKSMNERN